MTPHQIKTKLQYAFVFTVLIGSGLTACKKTDEYYKKLSMEPELYSIKAYDEVYGLGDTVTMYGRFMSDNLKVRIGDAEAIIIDKKDAGKSPMNIYNDDNIQVIRMQITQAMGMGENRPVSITSEDVTIKGPSIEIVADRNSSVLTKGLTVQRIADYPVGYLPVYCRSGNGNMYFIKPATVELIRINSNGITTALSFNATNLKDNDGTMFTVTRLDGYGVDPEERYLYLSLYQQAPSGSQWNYYRLCRYNLHNGSFTVLNKTPYGVNPNMNTEAAAKPFEGSIENVKMFSVTGIYPDMGGKVYFNIDNRIITRLDASGNYTYRIKNENDFAKFTDRVPQIYDEATGNYKVDPAYLRGLLPGKAVYFHSVFTIDPSHDNLYVEYSPIELQVEQYNLSDQKAGGVLHRPLINNGVAKPYSVGSFKVLNYSTGNNNTFGFMPLQDGRLVALKYQDLVSNETFKNYNLPHWAVIDFTRGQGELYAPGTFDRSGNTLRTASDVLLNYDNQGMLYMTGNSKRDILKTVYK